MAEETDDPDLNADAWFTRNLRARRLEAGLSQRQMGERMREIGFPFEQQTVQRIESGGRRASIGEARALARILGLNAMVLTEPPELTRDRALLRAVTLKLREHRAQADAVSAALRACARELTQITAEARAGENAALLAAEIDEAEKVLEKVR